MIKTVKIDSCLEDSDSQDEANEIVKTAKSIIEKSPPELVADLMSKGVVIAGGGALLRGLAPYIEHETGIPARLEEDPLTTVVRGTGVALENMDLLKEVRVNL